MKKTIFLFFAAILCAVGMNAYGATQRYIYVGLSNNYHQWKNESQWGINHWGGTGGGVVPGSKITDLQTTITHSGCTFHMYRMYVYDDNKNFEFKGNDGWWDCKKENISISGTTKNAILFRDNDGGDGGNPTFYQTDYKETSTVSLSASAASVSVGEEVTLTPTLTSNAEFNEIKSITYSVGTGATVSTDGKFVATAAGTYTVTATITYNPKHFTGITTEVNNLTCEIVVSEVVVPHPVTDVTVNPTSVTIKQGATATLTATVAPSNADDPSVTWSSDNQSVATVDNGIVTAVAPGTANITVTTVDGGFTATCAVKVKPLQYTFYAINSAQWPTVAAHYWEGADGGSAWPGANMVKESETINGFDIYSITISSDFVNIMFTNQIDGDNNKKTADLTTEGNDGKYYDIKDAKWYASLSEVPVSYDYYVIGTINSWGLKDAAYGLELNEDVYEKEVALAIGKHELKINNGTWDNASTFGYDNLSVAYEEVSRGSGEGDNNIVIDLAEAKTITVKLDKNTKKITLEGLTEKAPEPTYDYYLTGSLVGGWGVKQQGIEKDGELYKATFTELNAGTYEFKITAGDWEHQWNYNNLGAAYEEVSQGVDDEGKPNGNIKIVTEEAKNITVIFDATEDKITLEGLTPYVVPLTYTVTVPAGTEQCYIAGSMNGWAFQEMEAVTGETNKFTITIVGAKETDEYKYACQADWAYAEVIDGGGNRTNWSELDEVTAWGKPVIVTYQLKGVGGWEQPGIELVQNPDPEKASEYMLTCQAISATDAIKVVRLEGGEIKDYYGNGTVKDGVEVTVNSDNDGNIQLPEGTYNFYFDTAEPEKKLWIAEATDCVTTEEKTIFIEEGLEYSVNGTTVTITGRYNDELFELKISDCDINNLEDQTCPITMSIGEFGANGYIENQNATVAVWFSGYIQVTATGLQDYDNSNITYNIDITAAPSAEEGLSEINVEVYDAVCTINEDNMLTMLSTTAGVQVNVYNFDRTVAMAEYDYVLYTYDGMASGKTNVAIDGNTVSINVETTGEDNDGNEIPVIAFVSGELPAAEEEDPTQPQTMDIKVTDLVVEDNVVTGTGSNFTFVLTLVDYAGEDGTYVLSDESFVRSGMSLRGYAATGSLTKAVDEDYGTYFRGTIQATVGETPFTFNLTMVSEVTKEENIAAAATVTYNEENDVVFSANWNGTPISITLEGFENVAEKQYGELTLSIGTGEDEFYAFGEPIAYVNGKEIRIEGEFYSYITETIYNVALWGTLPDYTRTVTSGNYGTICLPNAAASTTGAIFYRVAGKEEGKVYLESVDALEAGVPYIFEATAGTITVTYQGEAVAEAGTANGLVGTFVETTVPDGDYILYNNAFCTNEPAGTLNKIKENRAYLDMDAVTGGAPQQLPGRRYIGMSVQGENEATGFEDITAPEGQAIKAIINGQLIIIRGGEKYNVQGQKL